jgi:hypothetical protein
VADKRVMFQGMAPGSERHALGKGGHAAPRRIFLLSPANASGVRANALFDPNAQFDLAYRLRSSSAPLGEVFSFISGLYFRGKLAYAERFANPPVGVAGVHIITAAAGLWLPQQLVTVARLKAICAARVDPDDPKYRRPLDRDARRLRAVIDPDTQVVLLGSISTPKYVIPLLEVFGERLYFPQDFVGRGDMSRGGLLLRCCTSESPLEYAPVANATRRGPRPPKLTRLARPAKK